MPPSDKPLTIVLSRRERVSKVVLKTGDPALGTKSVVHKHQPKYLTDNEYGFLRYMAARSSYGYRYVPWVKRIGIEELEMEYIEPEEVTDADEFMSHLPQVLYALKEAGIRHGDLTEYAIIPHKNRPIIIDFAEARWINDPIPPKRPEPDAVLLERAMRKLCMRL